MRGYSTAIAPSLGPTPNDENAAVAGKAKDENDPYRNLRLEREDRSVVISGREGDGEGEGVVSRRRRKHYSDKEISALLAEEI